MKKLGLLASVFLFAACAEPVTTPSKIVESDSPASFNAAPEIIPGRFIVTVADGVDPAAVARAHGISADYVYRHAINGFAGAISDLARGGMLGDARIVSIEPDGEAHALGIETGATWGLDRVDQRNRPVDGLYHYNNTGAGVTAYIIDTGIRFDHQEFGGRAVTGFDAVTSGGNAADCNGHGTHVSGTVGGSTYGVAKGVTLVAVRVLDCSGSGSWSGVIAGMDWATANHVAGTPAVANMSLGGGASTSVDAAVNRMIDDGIAVAVAAGNGNIAGIAQDACKSSPARVPRAMTIGATDNTDRKASWSNYGNCVDWFAPGVSITSSWYTSTTATNTISGTSMATPHTVGVAALYLQSNPGASPQTVRDALFANATAGIVTSSKTVNNRLLFSNY
jgi:subtilisin family serine protease